MIRQAASRATGFTLVWRSRAIASAVAPDRPLLKCSSSRQYFAAEISVSAILGADASLSVEIGSHRDW